uniref:cytochrome b n=1 Tax=Lima vulgaris TaxID=2671060 RepID=UPI0028FC7F70|nr:cytochrome b [Lima vulgaris]WNB40319.1 cytochrome b [Lima vulgaris]
MPFRKKSFVLRSLSGMIYDLPCPANLSAWWNFGSLLGVCLGIQIVSGLFLAMHYSADESLAFESVVHIWRDVNFGWFLRSLHANTASAFMFCMFMHIGRGIYYGSYLSREVWGVGVVILVLVMGVAFMGYVLPWGQMSFWGATVITNMVTVIPYIGGSLAELIWGGYGVGNPTLKRFFVLHFLLPFVIVVFAVVHLSFLHESGSNNPLGISADYYLVRFHSYYTVKDLAGVYLFFCVLLFFVFFYPHFFSDPANFIPANYMKTPEHIKPEWYFLFAYAILRSIPTKAGGVLAMAYSVTALLLLPSLFSSVGRSLVWYPLSQHLFWLFICSFFLLTWVGGKPVEDPFIGIGCSAAFVFLSFFSALGLAMQWEDRLVQGWFMSEWVALVTAMQEKHVVVRMGNSRIFPRGKY